MSKGIVLGLLLALAPVAAFAMGGYGGSNPSGRFGGGNSAFDNESRQDVQTAVRLIEKEDYAGAIPFLRRALRLQQGNADILNYLGFTSRMIGEYSDSLDYYQRALARNPDHKGAHEYLGELYLTLHQPDQAKAQLAELTRLCPDGCVERETLTQSIAKYEATAQATPATPTTAAAPAATTGTAPATANSTPPATAPQANAKPQ